MKSKKPVLPENPFLIIDSCALAYSSKYVHDGLSWAGRNTNVIYGFIKGILTLCDTFKTRRFVFAWDSGKSERRILFPDYKKNRRERNEEEIEEQIDSRRQIGELRSKILPDLGFNNMFIQTGMEADDVIASLVLSNEGEKVVVSDDRDLYQLLDHCSLYKQRKKVLYTKESLREEWNCTPDTWRRMKVLAGCSGDGVPNIPGVGELTAIKYLNGQLKGKKLLDINRWCIEEKEFLNRNRSLVCLPFRGTCEAKISPFGKISKKEAGALCEWYGMSSLFKGKYLDIWNYLCEEE